MMRDMGPDYKQIYTDIIDEKYPEKKGNLYIKNKMDCMETVMDVLSLNTLIFGETMRLNESKNQKLRSYDEISILKILEYQQDHKLNNKTTALHFKMSRNTLARWKTIYKDKF